MGGRGSAAEISDAAATMDALAPDGAALRDGAPDAGSPTGLPTLNCGSLADGCTPGQPCPPACACVTARERGTEFSPAAVIDQCTLIIDTGTPSVDIRSHVVITCL
jgi:hypothetical protein